MLFVCTLSSTVQSSIAFTSMARGNVPGAICAATASNLLGTVLTPLLVAVLLHRQGGGHGLADAGRILLQLLLPFALGSLLRPGSAPGPSATTACCPRWTEARSCWPSTPPSAKRWRRASGTPFRRWTWPPWCWSTRYCWSAVLLITTWGARRLGLSKENEITLVFCGSKKSLASGIPLATVLFGTSQMGIVVLP